MLFLDLVALWNSFFLFPFFFFFFPEQLEVHEVIYECLYVASFKSHLNPGRRVNETRDLWKFVKYCRTMQIAPQLRNEINREGYDWIDFSFVLLAMRLIKTAHNYLTDVTLSFFLQNNLSKPSIPRKKILIQQTYLSFPSSASFEKIYNRKNI